MARYQIRTPLEEYLEDVITQLADSGWNALDGWNVFYTEGGRKENIPQFRKAIRTALASRVRKYRLCGLSNVCLENLKSTKWAPEKHVLDANPTDTVYHLFPRTDLNDFLAELAASSLHPIEDSLDPSKKEMAFRMLQNLFQSILAHYLYFSPICGKTELCVYSSSAPVKIWKKKNNRGELLEELRD